MEITHNKFVLLDSAFRNKIWLKCAALQLYLALSAHT